MPKGIGYPDKQQHSLSGKLASRIKAAPATPKATIRGNSSPTGKKKAGRAKTGKPPVGRPIKREGKRTLGDAARDFIGKRFIGKSDVTGKF